MTVPQSPEATFLGVNNYTAGLFGQRVFFARLSCRGNAEPLEREPELYV